MIKVLYIVSTLNISGPTNQLFNIICNLDRTLYEPYLITLSPELENSRWQGYEEIDVKLFSLNLSRVQGVFLAKIRLKKLIEEIQPSVIHTQGFRADTLLSKLKVNVPKVTTIHNFPQCDYKMTYGWFFGSIILCNHIRSIRKLDVIIGCSGSVANNLIKVFNLSDVIGIPNGVDQRHFLPSYDRKNHIKNKLNLSPSSKLWISTGHLSELKDPVFLIKAWLKFSIENEGHHLIFLGSGRLAEQCENISSESKNIHLIGRVNNVVDYLQAADYFVSASKSEGLPMAAIEAMACGLPVFLSDIEPHKEIHAMSSNIGFLYELGDEDSFLCGIEKLKSSNYETYSKAALDLISNELSATKMSEKYQRTYKNL